MKPELISKNYNLKFPGHFIKTTGLILLIGGISFLQLACKSEISEKNIPVETAAFKTELVKIFKESYGCKSPASKNCARLKIEFPELSKGKFEKANNIINENIQLQLLQPIFDEGEYPSFDSLVNAFFIEFETLAKDYPESAQDWEIERILTVKNQTEKILTIEYSEYSFLGGAHPNNFITYSNYYLETGEQVSLDECLQIGYEGKLNSEGEKIFRQQRELKPDADLADAGFWFDENKFELNDNFAILKDGLLFYFNSYDIAPYAFGPTEVLIPYSKIKNLVLPDKPLSEFNKN